MKYKKGIYRIQHEHDAPAAYYHTRAEADRAWEGSEEPLEYAEIDPVAECEELQKTVDDQRRELNAFSFVVEELLEIMPLEAIKARPEARKAMESIREYHRGYVEDLERQIKGG